jgi:recombinational DNA repair protein (RecF pathway)
MLNTNGIKNSTAEFVVCTECKKPVPKGSAYYFGKNQILCSDCFEKSIYNSQKCPNCGEQITYEAESVGLLLTPKGATEEEKKHAVDTLVIVCPKCPILFFDDFHYKVLEGLKRK